MRHTEPALLFGDYVGLNPDDEHVFSFLRRLPSGTPGRSLVVALNMSGSRQTVHLDLPGDKVAGKSATVLESNYSVAGTSANLDKLELPPYGAVMLALQ